MLGSLRLIKKMGYVRRRDVETDDKVLFRFASFSDTHFGINDNVIARTYEEGREWARMEMLRDNLISEKQGEGLDFFIGNGDVVHNSSARWNSPAEMLEHVMDEYLDEVGVPYYLTPGNHDIIAEEDWHSIVGRHRSTAFEHNDFGFILLDSSDTEGTRQICIDLEFVQNKLREFSNKKGIFFVSHIPRYKGNFHDIDDADSPDCDPIMESLEQNKKVILMTSGHFHYYNDRDMQTSIPLFFSGHASNYGVPYYCYRTFDVYENKVITREWNMFDEKYEDEYVIEFY